jgi:Rrf2 family iron-sulfur cluster assembly transcriptional regulator
MYIAASKKDCYLGAIPIAREIKAPQNYLSKILKNFTRLGLLESQRGSGGGVRLVKSAADIFLYDIVEPIENLSSKPTCFMNKLCCGPEPCKHHAAWTKLHENYIEFLKTVSIGDLVEQNKIDPDLFVMPGIRKEK